MKHHLILLILAILFMSKGIAQKVIKAKDAHKYIGKIVTVKDTIYNKITSSYLWTNTFYLGRDADYKRLTVFTPYIDSVSKSNANTLSVTGLVKGDKKNPIIDIRNKPNK